MPKPWSQVASDPRFQSLSPEEQGEARLQYFDEVVKPQVPEQDHELAKSQFLESTSAPALNNFAGGFKGEALIDKPVNMALSDEKGPLPQEILNPPRQVASQPAQVAQNNTPPQITAASTNRVNAFDSSVAGINDTASFGFNDEIRGLGHALAARIKGQPTGNLINSGIDRARSEAKLAEQSNPNAYLGGQVGGAVLPMFIPGGAEVSGGRALSLGQRILQGVGKGAASGGAYGLGNAEGDAGDRAQAAIPYAVSGGIVGGSLPVAARGLEKLNTKVTIPTSDIIKKKGQELYDLAEKHGGAFSSGFTDNLISKISKVLPQTSEGATVAGQSIVNDVADRFSQLQGKPLSLKGIHEIDKFLGGRVQALAKAGEDEQAYGIRSMQGILRDMVKSPENNTFLQGNRLGIDALNEGRKNFSAAYKLNDIEDIIHYADTYAQPATAIKTGFRRLAKDAERLGYSPEEIKAIDNASRTGVLTDIMSTFGSRLGAIAGGATGGVPGAILGYGSSAASRAGATASQMSRANNAARLVAERSGLVTEEKRISADKLKQLFAKKLIEPEKVSPAPQQLQLAAPDKMSAIPMSDKQIAMAQALLRKSEGGTGSGGIIDNSGNSIELGNITPQNHRPLIGYGDNMSRLPMTDSQVSISQAINNKPFNSVDTPNRLYGFTPAQAEALITKSPSQQAAIQEYRRSVGSDWDKIDAAQKSQIENQISDAWTQSRMPAQDAVSQALMNAKQLANESGIDATNSDIAQALMRARGIR